MDGAGCCVVNNEVWVCGGATPGGSYTDAVYSWLGGERKWIERPHLPDMMHGHTALYDGDKAIWALAGYKDTNVYKYELGAASWMTMEPHPKKRYNCGCVRHGQYIFSLGGAVVGEWSTNNILVTNTNTGNTFTANIKLPDKVMGHCVAIIQPTT